jgi:hypothetical protein
MFIIDHSIKEGADPRTSSRAACSSSRSTQGQAINAGWAPHLDLEPIALPTWPDRGRWLRPGSPRPEQQALAHASTHWCPSTSTRCAPAARSRRQDLAAVHERLVKEINFWSDRYIKLQDDIAARTCA